jgi:hypothetical protein
VPLIPNATISTTRAGVANLLGVSLRIYPDSFEKNPIGALLEQAPQRFIADPGTDLQIGDVISGYNPTGINPAYTFVVRHIVQRDGLLPHLEGILLPMPNATKLTQYQQVDQVGLMPSTAAILRDTPAADGEGGWQSTYVQISTVACRLRALGAAEEVSVGSELAGVTQWELAVPTGTDIQVRDRVQINTFVYEVIDPLGLGTWSAERRVIIVRIQRV